ncbi:MAG: synthase subunit delta [Frankiales bacterium]|nr:synthase subunit delta [Frankiales bacterium]
MQGASRDALAVAREQLAATRGDLDLAAAGEGLLSVVRLLDRETQLRRTLGDPTTDAQAKDALLDSLLGSQLDAGALRLVKAAVAQRWSSSRDLVDAVEVLGVTALLLEADGEGRLDTVEAELFRFERALAGSPELRAVLTDRGLDAERKTALLDGLLDGKADGTTRRVIAQAVLAPRGRTIEDALEQFSGLAADVRSRTLATVTSAAPLDDAQRSRLAATLTSQLGREVQLQVEVDPKVVGGVLVKVGDEVIDGSTRHRLAQARRSLS